MDINNEPESLEVERDLHEPLTAELERYSHIDSVVFSLPGFEWAKEVYQNEYRSKILKQLDEVSRFSSCSDDVKNRIKPQISQAIAQIQAYQAWNVVWIEILDILAVTSLFIITVISLVLAPSWSQSEIGVLGWSAIILGIFLVIIYFITISIFFEDNPFVMSIFILIVLITGIYWLTVQPEVPWIPRFVLDTLIASSVVHITLTLILIYTLLLSWLESKKLHWSMSVLIFTLIGVYWLSQLQVAWLHQFVQDALIWGLIGGFAIFLLWLVFYLLDKILGFLFYDVRARRYPKEEIVQTLSKVLALVEFEPDRWSDTDFRTEVVADLQWIRRRIERDLYRSLSTNDADINAWLLGCLDEIAADFQRLIQNVLLPQQETRDSVIKNLTTKLVDAAEGNWGKFERKEHTPSQSLVKAAIHTMRTIISIAFPFLIVVAVAFIPTSLSEQIKNTIVMVALGWGVLGVILLIDPKFGAKITAVKSLESFMKKKG